MKRFKIMAKFHSSEALLKMTDGGDASSLDRPLGIFVGK